VGHGRLYNTWAWPFGGNADLFARVDASTTFEEFDAGGSISPAYGWYDVTLSAGLRGRL
jgi:hypothetical protein